MCYENEFSSETLMSLKTLTILAYFLLLMDFGYNYFIKEGGGLVRCIFRIMYGNVLFNISTHQSLPIYDYNKTLVHKILTVKIVVGCKG